MKYSINNWQIRQRKQRNISNFAKPYIKCPFRRFDQARRGRIRWRGSKRHIRRCIRCYGRARSTGGAISAAAVPQSGGSSCLPDIPDIDDGTIVLIVLGILLALILGVGLYLCLCSACYSVRCGRAGDYGIKPL